MPQRRPTAVTAVLTNSVQQGPYRWSVRILGLQLVSERMVDAAVDELRRSDPVEFRRRNFHPPEAFPLLIPDRQSPTTAAINGACSRCLRLLALPELAQ